MYSRLLVPLDGSSLAARALPYAETIARFSGAELLLVRAVEHARPIADREPKREQKLIEAAEGEIGPIAAEVSERGVPVSTVVISGEPSGVILENAQSNNVDLIVMSTHGRSGLSRFTFGSVAEKVLKSGITPVLLVPPNAVATWQPPESGTILVPLDGSPLAEEGIEAARRMCRLLHGGMLLLQVIEPPNPGMYGMAPVYPDWDVEAWAEEARPYVEAVAERLRSEGFRVETGTQIGSAPETICQAADSRAASMIVMASHGRSGLPRIVLGSVAQGVVQRTDLPVLVVRPAAIPNEEGEPAGAGLAAV